MQTQPANSSAAGAAPATAASHWSCAQAEAIYAAPFNDLLFCAHSVHRQNFDANEIQLSTLMNIKSGGCPEDCGYCPQSVHYQTGVSAERLEPLENVLAAARAARASGATRFCMGAAWRSPRGSDFERVLQMVSAVKREGLETCATLGMLSGEQARQLQAAGLDYYNHNIDTSEQYYREIIHTREFRDRLETLRLVQAAGMKVCSGGIVGMGETRRDRCQMLVTLANLPEQPQSVPVNLLVRGPGTPLADAADIDPLELVRTIALARILMPAARVRLSAGRGEMPDVQQALCFFAGANSIFYGDRLLTTDNPAVQKDLQLLDRLGLRPSA